MTGAHVLILAGTAEGRQLASRLAGRPGLRVTSALAGRTPRHAPRPGDVRVGGFGGADELRAWLRLHRVAAVIDATHPFAQTISAHAAMACAESGTPLISLLRPPYAAVPGDDWHRVGSVRAAAELLPSLGRRAFLTTGQQGLAAFAVLDQLWFLIRCITPGRPAAGRPAADPGSRPLCRRCRTGPHPAAPDRSPGDQGQRRGADHRQAHSRPGCRYPGRHGQPASTGRPNLPVSCRRRGLAADPA